MFDRWIWVALVQSHKTFRCIKVSHDSSWGWRRLLKLRNEARYYIKFAIGKESQAFLWYDGWQPYGILNDKYEYKPIYHATSSLEAMVESVLKNGAWNWQKTIRSNQLLRKKSNCVSWKLVIKTSFCGRCPEQRSLLLQKHGMPFKYKIWSSMVEICLVSLAIRDMLSLCGRSLKENWLQ